VNMKVVAAAVIEKDGRFLLARRSPDEKLAGMWEFPGGKLEHGESLEECIERELLEELGVRAVAGRVLQETHYRYDHGEFLLKAIQVQLLEYEFSLSVHDQVCWARPTEFDNLNLAPADIPIARALREAANGL
jgi:8-oxo-dGTP diphosphatase